MQAHSQAHYKRDQLFIENVSLESIVETYGTPTYVYSRAAIEEAFNQFSSQWSGMDHTVCYSVKANSNLGVLSLLARLGSGFDIVSQGELERVIRAGGDPRKTVFSGVGKTRKEISRALELGIFCFNVESRSELELIEKVADSSKLLAPVSIRVNPDVDAKTHPYIATGLKNNKFGVSAQEAIVLYEYARQSTHLQILGIDCHIGSQITEISPFTQALEKILELSDQLAQKGIEIQHLDLGGGLGVRYEHEPLLDLEEYSSAIKQMLGSRKYHLIFEPGRFITANAGWLVTRLLYMKTNEGKNFAVVDTAMNDLLRPALYQAWQEVLPAVMRSGEGKILDVVGPVCESADYLAKDRELNLQENDLLAIGNAGAYGFSMSSNYNSRNRPAEIIVDGSESFCVRKRETIEDQLRLESTWQDQ